MRIGTFALDGIYEFVIAHHIRQFGTCLYGVSRAESKLQFVRTSFLGSDQDNPVGCARTIDSCGGCVFQNGHALNIVRVDEAKEIAVVTTDTSLFQRNTVQYNQRVVAGIQ